MSFVWVHRAKKFRETSTSLPPFDSRSSTTRAYTVRDSPSLVLNVIFFVWLRTVIFRRTSSPSSSSPSRRTQSPGRMVKYGFRPSDEKVHSSSSNWFVNCGAAPAVVASRPALPSMRARATTTAFDCEILRCRSMCRLPFGRASLVGPATRAIVRGQPEGSLRIQLFLRGRASGGRALRPGRRRGDAAEAVRGEWPAPSGEPASPPMPYLAGFGTTASGGRPVQEPGGAQENLVEPDALHPRLHADRDLTAGPEPEVGSGDAGSTGSHATQVQPSRAGPCARGSSPCPA